MARSEAPSSLCSSAPGISEGMSCTSVPPSRDVQNLDAAADCQHRQVGIEGASNQLDFVFVPPRFGGVISGMSSSTVDLGTHVAASGQEQPAGRHGRVSRAIARLVEHPRFAACATDRFLVVVQLLAGCDGDYVPYQAHVSGDLKVSGYAFEAPVRVRWSPATALPERSPAHLCMSSVSRCFTSAAEPQCP